MFQKAKWIWLDEQKYPYLQESNVAYFSADKVKYRFGVAAFKKTYKFEKTIKQISIKVFGDTRYFLWINNEFVGLGPVASGGDVVMPEQFFSEYIVPIEKQEIKIYAEVQLTPTVEMDNSSGHGGFIFEASVVFEDGSENLVYTDNTWLSRHAREYLSPRITDYCLKDVRWDNAVQIDSIWNIKPSEIKNIVIKTINEDVYITNPHTKQKFFISLDKIHSGYFRLNIKAKGNYRIRIISFEKENVSKKEHIITGNSDEKYYSHELDAIGEFWLTVENESDDIVEVKVCFDFSYYPSCEEGAFCCSDKVLNKIYDVGKWTVKICRQSIELDSPVHQENLHCVGDYMIESLVNNITTGDYTLTRFDIIRLANYFCTTKGYIYHNSYALLWFQMLYDYYMYSGDIKIFDRVLGAIEAILTRFAGYENEKGIIENVTNYMFVDWTYIDGYSLHNPPQALGQTVLNAFYYQALVISSKIYEILGNTKKADFYRNKCKKLKHEFNKVFYDENEHLYIDGTSTATGEFECMPKNPEKTYYTAYSNTLAVLYELCDKANEKNILKKILDSEKIKTVQPYFYHYVFEAMYRVGLFEEYRMKHIRIWAKLTEECDKGMKEYMHTFDGYAFDYSHGWSSTPTYQLATKISGLKIIEPGFKKIVLNPNLYDLDFANMKIPTPYGNIELKLKRNEKAEINIPSGIEVV